MKTNLTFKNACISISICVFTLVAQAQEGFKCGQTIVTENWLKAHPELLEAYIKNQQQIPTVPTNDLQSKAMASAAPLYTIPIVFHILHLGGVENISDAQVIDQVAILNRDYQKQNADTSSVVSTYTNNIANVRFAFQLARIDPNGNCTNGIIRHYDPNTVWDANNFSYFAYTWPRDKYLNIYVVRSINIQATAYTFLPSVPVPVSADVIVTLHNMVGSIGTGNPGTTSRVLTHEVGHWFNLQHIWGTSNQPGVTCGDDGVTDTPITKGFINCNNPANAIVCNPGIIENIQNYMDYSPCKLMFTNGQSQRMLASLTSTVNNRNNLYSLANQAATGITSSTTNCIPLVELSIPATRTVCTGTALSIQSFTSNANSTLYTWSVSNGASINNPSAANVLVTFNTVGTYTVSCVAANSNGSSTASCVVVAVNGVANFSSTSAESFEAATLPINWSILNPNTTLAFWSLTNAVGSQGVQSMFVNGENAPNNSVEILQSPSFDFLNSNNATLTFKYAYARQTATHADVFKVQASKDCGGSWQDIYVPNMNAFANGSGGVSSTLFIPTATQWKFFDLTNNLNNYNLLSEPNVTLRFYFQEDATTGYGNRLYLDEINFTTTNGVNEWTQAHAYQVYPNPAKDKINMAFTLSEATKINWCLTSIEGKTVLSAPTAPYAQGTHHIAIETNGLLPLGIYFLLSDFNGFKMVKKIIID